MLQMLFFFVPLRGCEDRGHFPATRTAAASAAPLRLVLLAAVGEDSWSIQQPWGVFCCFINPAPQHLPFCPFASHIWPQNTNFVLLISFPHPSHGVAAYTVWPSGWGWSWGCRSLCCSFCNSKLCWSVPTWCWDMPHLPFQLQFAGPWQKLSSTDV